MNALRLLVDAGTRPIRAGVSSAVQSVVWLGAVAILAIVALGFGVAALHTWLAFRFGPIEASLIIAGLFLALAIVVFAIHSYAAAEQRSRARREAERSAEALRGTLANLAGVVSAAKLLTGRRRSPEARAVADPEGVGPAGRATKSAGPWSVIAIALMGGFVGAHFIDRGRR
jgi:type VI protein secretion system component VasK